MLDRTLGRPPGTAAWILLALWTAERITAAELLQVPRESYQYDEDVEVDDGTTVAALLERLWLLGRKVLRSRQLVGAAAPGVGAIPCPQMRVEVVTAVQVGDALAFLDDRGTEPLLLPVLGNRRRAQPAVPEVLVVSGTELTTVAMRRVDAEGGTRCPRTC